MTTDILNAARNQIRESRPLIHAITSPIAINDVANAVLALGAQPICAEHPAEVFEITSIAKALTVSLANITDVRMESMKIAGLTAKGQGIPVLIDAVGVTCSSMRMKYAREYIAEVKPSVIKGNYSEIRALSGMSFDQSSGIDVSEKDQAAVTSGLSQMKRGLMAYAASVGAVVLATGAVDLVADSEGCVEIRNGHPLMSRVTGTGCVLSCVVGTFLSVLAPFEAAVSGTVCWGLAGELAAESFGDRPVGLGSYHEGLMDQLSLLTDEVVAERGKIS